MRAPDSEQLSKQADEPTASRAGSFVVEADDGEAEVIGQPLRIGRFELRSRLIMGTGRYDSFEQMQRALAASGTDCVTVAVRRERLHDSAGRNILDYLDLDRYTLLPNTAGSYDAQTAMRCARMGREILAGLGNAGAEWVKLEVLGDSRTLLPDGAETLKATEKLVDEGFQVLCYTNDDPITALNLKRAGAAAVMPAGSPIGSGQGIANPLNLQIILEQLKADDPDYPVIVDAGLGTASDVVVAFEMGVDAVLLNTAVARAGAPVQMASSMKLACQAGRLARFAERMGKSLYGSASSPEHGQIATRIVDTPQ